MSNPTSTPQATDDSQYVGHWVRATRIGTKRPGNWFVDRIARNNDPGGPIYGRYICVFAHRNGPSNYVMFERSAGIRIDD